MKSIKTACDIQIKGKHGARAAKDVMLLHQHVNLNADDDHDVSVTYISCFIYTVLQSFI